MHQGGWLNRSWSIVEFDISYRSCATIKVQALANFIAKDISNTLEMGIIPIGDVEQIFTKGSSTSCIMGSWCTFIFLNVDLINYGLVFLRCATNKETEYEALIRELHIAKGARVRCKGIKCVLQLVVRQVNIDYNTKEENIACYVKWLQALMKTLIMLHSHRSLDIKHYCKCFKENSDGVALLLSGLS